MTLFVSLFSSHPSIPPPPTLFSRSGTLHARELQIPPPARPPEDPAGDQRAKQPDPAEDSGRHVGPTDAVHDPRHHHATCG